MKFKGGSRLRSTVCSTEVVIVRAPDDDVDLRCGGAAMQPLDSEQSSSGTPAAGFEEGTRLGKRYADEALGIEVLCTKAGDGSLSIGDETLGVKEPKPLPASD